MSYSQGKRLSLSSCAVAIVSFCARDHLAACLRSVGAEPAASVVVIDHGSVDGSVEMVRATFPHVRLEVDESNPGYGAGANRALGLCDSPYVLLLNSDTEVRPGCLRAIASYLDAHPRVAIAGPRLLDPDGSLQPSCYPFLGTFRLMLEKSPLGRLLARVPILRDRWLLTLGSHDRVRDVPWVSGAALGIRREAFLAVGGFDPSYFLYAEEVDLCYRLRHRGWSVHFVPAATVVHAGGASTRSAMEVQRVRSSRAFYRRHYSPARAAALSAAIAAAMIARQVRDSLRRRLARDPAERARLEASIALWKAARW